MVRSVKSRRSLIFCGHLKKSYTLFIEAHTSKPPSWKEGFEWHTRFNDRLFISLKNQRGIFKNWLSWVIIHAAQIRASEWLIFERHLHSQGAQCELVIFLFMSCLAAVPSAVHSDTSVKNAPRPIVKAVLTLMPPSKVWFDTNIFKAVILLWLSRIFWGRLYLPSQGQIKKVYVHFYHSPT